MVGLWSAFLPKVPGDICKLQGGYAFKSSEFSSVGVPVVKIADVTGGGQIDYSSMQCVPKEVALKAERFATTPRDTLISMTGANVGKVSRVGNEVVDARINQRVGRFVPKVDLGYSKDYIHYVVSADTAYAYFATAAYGSAQPNISASLIESLPIPAFPADHANLIGSALSALDDKVELNRQMNQTLEAMARAVFLDWFVDFGPTRRKAAGATDPAAILGGLIPNPTQSAPLAALFPDSFGANGLPMGWGIMCFDDVANLKNGFAFKSSDWSVEGIPVIKIGSVRPSLVDIHSGSFVGPSIAEGKEAFRASAGSALIGLTGYVGEVGRVPPCDERPLVNQRVARIDPKNKREFSPFIYTIARTPEFKAFVISKSHGSAQANVSTKDISSFSFVGTEAIIAEFDRVFEAVFDKQLCLYGENQTLAATRDLLLPKLMSGELRLVGGRP